MDKDYKVQMIKAGWKVESETDTSIVFYSAVPKKIKNEMMAINKMAIDELMRRVHHNSIKEVWGILDHSRECVFHSQANLIKTVMDFQPKGNV